MKPSAAGVGAPFGAGCTSSCTLEDGHDGSWVVLDEVRAVGEGGATLASVDAARGAGPCLLAPWVGRGLAVLVHHCGGVGKATLDQ